MPAAPADAVPKGDWWRAFGDPQLDTLEARIAAGNQTLREAEAAYRNALALIGEARAGLFPTIGLSPAISRAATGRAQSTSNSLELQASWEIDLWGRIRRQVESNRALAQASAADLANTLLSEQSALAVAYVALRYEDALTRLLADTVANDARSLSITQNQYAAGVAARSDVITAQAQLDAARSELVGVGVSRAQDEHAIAALVGAAPAALSLPPAGDIFVLPAIPQALPATLLQRRPDVAAAERAMAAQNAAIGVAVAAYYPTLSLSALYGYVGDPLSGLIAASNRVWSLGAAASETLFEGGLRDATVAAAEASYDGAVATYRQTVLTALQQVEDQLAALRILADQAKIQDQAVADASRAAEIALNEYRAGTQAYTVVVIAQNTLLADQQTALGIRQQRLDAAVLLITALGGGYTVPAAP